MEKHFVKFLSPGTFLDEETWKEIDSWDIEQAIEMSKSIIERHNATPYGFQFVTRERSEEESDSRQTAKSGIYYLGGKIMTLDDVKRSMPDEGILISNMECNNWGRIIVNTNSWRICKPLYEDDQVIDENRLN